MTMARPFNDIRIVYDGLGLTTVSWVLDSRFDDPFPHNFELQFAANRAAFESGEYAVINQGQKVIQLSDVVFRDAGVSSAAFYRVQLTTPAGQYLSGIKGLDGNVSISNINLLKEILRKESLSLRKDRGGVEGLLFKRRYYGPKCGCRDKNSGTLISTACIKCAGTGFQDGYFPGIPFSISILGQEGRHSQISQLGTVDVRQLTVRGLANPVTDPKDIWQELDTHKVYEIKDCATISRLSYQTIATQIELRELPLVDAISLFISSTPNSIIT